MTTAPRGDTLPEKVLQCLLTGWRAGRERHGVEPDQGPEQLYEVVLAAGDELADPALELGGQGPKRAPTRKEVPGSKGAPTMASAFWRSCWGAA